MIGGSRRLLRAAMRMVATRCMLVVIGAVMVMGVAFAGKEAVDPVAMHMRSRSVSRWLRCVRVRYRCQLTGKVADGEQGC